MQLKKDHNFAVHRQNCLTKKYLRSNNIFRPAELRAEKYIGLCEGKFKKRFSSHKSTFNLEQYKNSTALSTEVKADEQSAKHHVENHKES